MQEYTPRHPLDAVTIDHVLRTGTIGITWNGDDEVDLVLVCHECQWFREVPDENTKSGIYMAHAIAIDAIEHAHRHHQEGS